MMARNITAAALGLSFAIGVGSAAAQTPPTTVTPPDNQFFQPGDVFWCREKMAQVNSNASRGLGASEAATAITNSLGPFENLAPEAKKTAIKSLMAVFKVGRAALEQSVKEFDEGLGAGCGKRWSAADAQEIDHQREAIKTIDTTLDQMDRALKTLQ